MPAGSGHFSAVFIGTGTGHALGPAERYIEWDRKLMWVGTGTGIYLITSPLLGTPLLKPMKIAEWVLPGLNAGHT